MKRVLKQIKDIWVAYRSLLLPFLIIALVFIFREKLYGVFGVENYLSIHTLLELSSLIVSFTIAIQAWMIFPYTLSNRHLFIGSLFFCMGLFDLFHAFNYQGMPFFFTESSAHKATWFWVVSRITLAFSLLLIVLSPRKQLLPWKRWLMYACSLIYFFIWSFCIIWKSDALPTLAVDGEGTTSLKNSLEYLVIILHLATLLILYFKRNQDSTPYPMLIVSLVYFSIGEYRFTLYLGVYDITNFIRHCFKLMGYYYLLRSLYFSSVEEPFLHQKRAEEKLTYLAYYDELTSLPNQRFFMEDLMKRLQKDPKQRLALFMLEIDRFKMMNDSLGYHVGDQIVQSVANCLKQCLPPKIILARMMGNQFVIALPHLADEKEIKEICLLIKKAFESVIQVQLLDLKMNVRIGVTIYPKDGDSVNVLLKNTHVALNEARDQKSSCMIYHPSMDEKAYRRLVLTNDLYRAIENKEFHVLYQPQIDTRTGKIIALEALLRWDHPKKGRISPAEFIPIAEETGLIISIGEWVIRKVCQQLRKWQDDGFAPMGVAVNLSTLQFYQENLAERVEGILKEAGISPFCLELEITESMTINIEQSREALLKLKKLGVSISIDDFGTGYSSLQYLKQLAIDRIKIDQSFIRGLVHDQQDDVIVTTFISITQKMNIDVIAEGVETIDQLSILQQKQCHQVQGYLFSPPLTPETLTQQYYEIQNKAKEYVRVGLNRKMEEINK
ncbi:bifunctional diguanylate cyclase/phosphodiesterase [Ammoniphilus resinae]|uniref:Diguanylate cyclase (GGDEF)-like protein n=1 Tax=Ammoniphilus resinae TaxID=861532 RepID=A0ABS4GWP0_9BACL|nr:EAL domain-containing protein [Ammoniphilus resinae]MBP1934682.1 diguanylate cyclase (GGDEF)-like protein [Ammoniphilus resinae]